MKTPWRFLQGGRATVRPRGLQPHTEANDEWQLRRASPRREHRPWAPHLTPQLSEWFVPLNTSGWGLTPGTHPLPPKPRPPSPQRRPHSPGCPLPSGIPTAQAALCPAASPQPRPPSAQRRPHGPGHPLPSGVPSLACCAVNALGGDVLSVPSPAQRRGRNKSSQIETLLNQIGQV